MEQSDLAALIQQDKLILGLELLMLLAVVAEIAEGGRFYPEHGPELMRQMGKPKEAV